MDFFCGTCTAKIEPLMDKPGAWVCFGCGVEVPAPVSPEQCLLEGVNGGGYSEVCVREKGHEGPHVGLGTGD